MGPAHADRRRSIRRHSVLTAVSGATERPLQWRTGTRRCSQCRSAAAAAGWRCCWDPASPGHEFTRRRAATASELVAAAASRSGRRPGVDRASAALLLDGGRLGDRGRLGGGATSSSRCSTSTPAGSTSRRRTTTRCSRSCSAGSARTHTPTTATTGLRPRGGGGRPSDARRPSPSDPQHPYRAAGLARSSSPSCADESLLVAPVLAQDGAMAAVVIVARLGAGRFSRRRSRAGRAGRRAGPRSPVARVGALPHGVRAGARLAGAARSGRGAGRADRGRGHGRHAGGCALDRLIECAGVSVWLRDGDQMRVAGDPRLHAARDRRGWPNWPWTPATPLFAGALDSARPDDRSASTRHGASRGGLDAVPEGTTFAVVAVGERSANRAAIVVQRGPRRGTPSALESRMLQGIADQALLAAHQPDAVRRAGRRLHGHRRRRWRPRWRPRTSTPVSTPTSWRACA